MVQQNFDTFGGKQSATMAAAHGCTVQEVERWRYKRAKIVLWPMRRVGKWSAQTQDELCIIRLQVCCLIQSLRRLHRRSEVSHAQCSVACPSPITPYFSPRGYQPPRSLVRASCPLTRRPPRPCARKPCARDEPQPPALPLAPASQAASRGRRQAAPQGEASCSRHAGHLLGLPAGSVTPRRGRVATPGIESTAGRRVRVRARASRCPWRRSRTAAPPCAP